ncbi:Hypothetical protein A7982_02331 [Minicystis rosea]|nr:Hypothetical protein A7982_02331 [Minicystis rosea]
MLALLLSACTTTSEGVVRAARAPRGRMGFGISNTAQHNAGGTVSMSRTGLAAASAPGIEPGGGDWAWRVTNTGTTLQLCHLAWTERPCRTALFDGAPNALPPFIKFGIYPVLIDPINLGRIGLMSTDTRGNVWVFSVMAHDTKNTTVPVSPGYGVWALGGGSTLHHCQLEGETPRCRAAKTTDGKPVSGLPITIKTYGATGEMHEGAWFAGATPIAPGSFLAVPDNLVHCDAKSGAAEAPTCKVAQLGSETIRISGLNPASVVLSSQVVAESASQRHVVWLQTDTAAIVRCQASASETPKCARAQMK